MSSLGGLALILALVIAASCGVQPGRNTASERPEPKNTPRAASEPATMGQEKPAERTSAAAGGTPP